MMKYFALAAALAVTLASGVAHAQLVGAGPRIAPVVVERLVLSTVTSTSATRAVGNRGVFALCGHGRDQATSVTCTRTSTNIGAMPYASRPWVLLADNNADDTLSVTRATVKLTGIDPAGNPLSENCVNNATLNETAVQCTRVFAAVYSVEFSSPVTSAAVTSNPVGLITDSSDAILLAVSDHVALPVPVRTTAAAAAQVDAVCVGTTGWRRCAKSSDCTFTVGKQSPAFTTVDVSTCFASGDQTDLATGFSATALENTQVTVRFRQ